MSQIKFSGLPAGGVPADSDIFCAVQGGNSRRVTALQLLEYILSDTGPSLPITRGGTGHVTANAALNALLPAQTGHAGESLQTNGTNTSWQPATGGVSSVTSTGGSISVNTVGGVANVEVDVTHGLVWTAGQVVHTTVGGLESLIHLGDGTDSAAVSVVGDVTGGQTRARLGLAAYGAEFESGGGVRQVRLAGPFYGCEVAGGPAFLSGGLDARTAVGFFGTAPVAQQAANQAMSDGTGGAASTTLSAVAGTGADATINDNLASLNARLAEVRALLLAYGLGS